MRYVTNKTFIVTMQLVVFKDFQEIYKTYYVMP